MRLSILIHDAYNYLQRSVEGIYTCSPSVPNFVTYFRVSTEKQGRSGLGLEAQQHDVRQHLLRTGGIELASFTEVESGKVARTTATRRSPPSLADRRGATLLVAKIDRLSRNAAFLFKLRDSDVKFQALDIPDANTLTLGVMIVMAQHERGNHRQANQGRTGGSPRQGGCGWAHIGICQRIKLVLRSWVASRIAPGPRSVRRRSRRQSGDARRSRDKPRSIRLPSISTPRGIQTPPRQKLDGYRSQECTEAARVPPDVTGGCLSPSSLSLRGV